MTSFSKEVLLRNGQGRWCFWLPGGQDRVIASRASDGGEVLREAEVIYSGSRFSLSLSWEPG